jgi:hypothetical protein
MYALVGVHEFPGHAKYSPHWKERDSRMWDPKRGRSFQRLYENAWKALAKEFAFHPATCVGFKTGNELDPWCIVNDTVLLDETRRQEGTALHLRLHKTIRDTERRAKMRDRSSGITRCGIKHLIVVEAPFNYRLSSLITWTPPECFFDGFTALGFHMYEPIDFTHQEDAWQERSITPKAYQGWFAESWGDGNFLPAWWDEHKIRQRLLLTTAEYQKAYGKVLPLLCTEFGAIKLAWGSDNYLWDVICALNYHWIGWTAHSWRERKWLEAIGRHNEESKWDFEGHAGRMGAIWQGFRTFPKM